MFPGMKKLKVKKREESLIQYQRETLDKYLIKKHVTTIGEGMSQEIND